MTVAAPRLRALQEAFTRGIYDDDAAVLAAIDHADAAARLAIHRNNTLASLRRVLANHFPAIAGTLGDAAFTSAARAFARHHPPAAPQLLDFGATFPDFLARSAVIQEQPWIVDLARLEWARNDAYHGPDAPRLDPQELGAVEPGRHGAVRFVVHPTAQLIGSRFPIYTRWRRAVGDAGDLPADDDGESVLVVRPELQVVTALLEPADAVFLSTLIGGAKLAEAAERAGAAHPGFNLQVVLAGHFARGTFTSLSLED